MRKFERIAGGIAILGILLKILHIPGGSILFLLTLTSLSIFYFLLSFALFNNIELKTMSTENTSTKRLVGAIGLGIAISATIIGGIFKLQLWPNPNMQLRLGLVPMGVILVVAIIFYFRNKADDYYKRIFKRIAIYGGLGLILYFTPSTILVDVYYRNNPEHAELLKKVLANPDSLELQQQLDEMRKQQ